jgi:dnd system-associated protein 4
MGDGRIKVAKDKTDLVKSLRAGDNTNGPFQSYADVLVFAASLGIKNQSRKPISEFSKEIDPIRQDIFQSKGYDQIINLIAVADTNDPRSVANQDDAEDQRIRIFEEYANAGLEILEGESKGFSNYVDFILLYLNNLSEENEERTDEFDLSKFISI